MPCYTFFAADLASSGPADLFAAAPVFYGLRSGKDRWGAGDGFEIGGDKVDCQAGVCVLERCFQAEFEGVQETVLLDLGEVDGLFLCAFEEDFFCSGGLGDGQCWGAGLHDSGFVPGDFFDGVTKELGVVDA